MSCSRTRVLGGPFGNEGWSLKSEDGLSVMERVTQLKKYFVDVRTEARKVVWPTRKDTMHTTIVVFGMVVLVSLFLWVVDALLALVVQSVIG